MPVPSPASPPPLLEARDVCRSLCGVPILERVSLELTGGGSITALLGPSGAGKSQLLRLLAGLDSPDSGSVHGPDGAPVTAGSIGLVLQGYPLFQHRTVRDNLLVAARAQGLPPGEARARAHHLLARLRLRERTDAFPVELSGGQRQRVAIAQQLVAAKRVLLLDEPFSGLDRAAAREVVRMLREMIAGGEIESLLFVTHDLRVAVELADRLLLLGRDPAVPGSGARVQAVHELAPLRTGDAEERRSAAHALEASIEGYFAALWQSHGKFRLFALAPRGDEGFGRVFGEVERFASTVAARSIGAEYLPGVDRLLVTVGYRDDERPYPVRLVARSIGTTEPARIEAALRELGEGDGVLCHDLFVASRQDAVLVVMALAA